MKCFLAMSGIALSLGAAHAQSAPPALPAAPVAGPAAVDQARPHKLRVRRPVAPEVARVAAANRAATQVPQAGGFVNAVQVYAYSEGAIYQVFTAPGVVTDIVLQPGENLVSVAAGDTVRWVIGDTSSGSGADKRTHVLVKPFSADLATNLVIATDRRSYHLQLNATSRTAMAALSWTYPADALIALRRAAAAAEAAAPVAQGLTAEDLRFNYIVDGDKVAWRPIRAFDDGRQTFVEFPETLAVGEAPPLFVIGASGQAELVNYRVRGRFYVVDRIFEAAELRLGTKKQQVVRIVRTAERARKGRAS
ncbi:MAG: P-type conjugative transfer protein TrbG [Sphingomonas sp.]